MPKGSATSHMQHNLRLILLFMGTATLVLQTADTIFVNENRMATAFNHIHLFAAKAAKTCIGMTDTGKGSLELLKEQNNGKNMY